MFCQGSRCSDVEWVHSKCPNYIQLLEMLLFYDIFGVWKIDFGENISSGEVAFERVVFTGPGRGSSIQLQVSSAGWARLLGETVGNP